MLQKEFETRVGYSVEPAEYSEIEQAYILYDGDKDAFCMMWKNASEDARSLIMRLAKKGNEADEQLAKANSDYLCMKEAYAHFLIDTREMENVREGYAMLGAKEYYKYVIDQGYELKEAEKEELIRLIG